MSMERKFKIELTFSYHVLFPLFLTFSSVSDIDSFFLKSSAVNLFLLIFSYGYIQVIKFWQKYHGSNVVFFLAYHINRPMLLICLVIDEVTPIICLTWYLPGFSTVKLIFPLQLESCGELLWGYLYILLLLKNKKAKIKFCMCFFFIDKIGKLWVFCILWLRKVTFLDISDFLSSVDYKLKDRDGLQITYENA